MDKVASVIEIDVPWRAKGRFRFEQQGEEFIGQVGVKTVGWEDELVDHLVDLEIAAVGKTQGIERVCTTRLV